MKRIAILGASGYIGKSLLVEFFLEQNNFKLFLFLRSRSKMKSLVRGVSKDSDYSMHSFDEFNLFDYDVVINCTGIGNPANLKNNPLEIFKVTEEMDNMVIDYLTKKPKTLYINLSSGAVYGDNFKQPLTNETSSIFQVNKLSLYEYYAVAKINAEAKHRAIPNLNIVDLRVFAFFSSFVDIGSSFLMSEIVSCLKNKKVFKTNEDNIIRDYITPKDLFALIKCVIKKRKLNDCFDVYSKKPISKFELLSSLQKKYGLKYVIKNDSKIKSSLLKKSYYSKNKKAENVGYIPKFSSLSGLEYEISKLSF